MHASRRRCFHSNQFAFLSVLECPQAVRQCACTCHSPFSLLLVCSRQSILYFCCILFSIPATNHGTAANEITGELLLDLDHDTLKSMGIASAGRRMRVLRVVGALKSYLVHDLASVASAAVLGAGPTETSPMYSALI
eukprot:Opistho-2@20073